MINTMALSPLQQLTIGDNHFAYRVSGSGPDVLLIHGWLSSSRMWESLTEYLSPYCRVWAIDLIGFGDSWTDDPSRVLTVDDQTRLVVVFCKALGLHLEAVVGHSMGGAIVLKLALEYPELVEKIVPVCPVVTGKIGWNLDGLLATSLAKSVLTFGQHVWPHMTQFSPLSFLVAPGYLSRDVMRRTFEDFQKASWGATYGGLVSLASIRLDQRLREIHKPVLIITGAQDLAVPCSEGRIAAEQIAGAELLEMPACHHQVPDEDPDQFHEALGQFLGLSASRSAYAA
jgi:pimeloyl-ACP methyl ester carboxylesterase